MRKAQSSLEFVLLVSFALLMGSSFLYVVQQNLANTQNARDEARVMQLFNILETEFTLAEKSPIGYKRTFLLPSSIDGQDYNVTGTSSGTGLDHDIVVNFNERDYVFLLPSSVRANYRNPLQKGENVIFMNCLEFYCELVIN